MKRLHWIAAAAAAASLALASVPAQAALTQNAADIGASPSVVDFESFDGLLTSGPVSVGPGITFTGDAGSELGAYIRDLGDNGAWGVGNHFAASGVNGELRFTFNALSTGAGAFVNHYALEGFPFAVVVSAYGDNSQIIETHTFTVDTAWDSYGEGVFLGITRSSADIRTLSFKGVGVVADNFTLAAPVPEPETYAMLLAGLCAVGTIVRRRRKG